MLGAGTDVHVLPNAVEPGDWRTGVPTYAEQRPEGAPLTVISVMRLTRVKRTLPLARILHDVRRAVTDRVPVRAVVVGDGPRRSAMESYLRRHDLDSWVELPGHLDRPVIRDELRRAAVFLAPAERESFGIAPLEARTVGLPVVASSRSGVGEFIAPGVNGCLGSTDEELTAQVVRLLTDEAFRTRIARHNRLVPPDHDWPSAVARADELYAEARARVVGLVALGMLS